jgi:triosephosphate isomerase
MTVSPYFRVKFIYHCASYSGLGDDMRTKIVAGNWKLNGSRTFAQNFLSAVLPTLNAHVNTIIVPPLPNLQTLIAQYAAPGLSFGAQDVGVHAQGAFTGDISSEMLKDIGCRYVLLGHSERRQFQQESSDLVAEKFVAAQRAGLTPILCVGESLHQRETGHTEWVLEKQLKPVLDLAGVHAFGQACIAYEPIWAIGTGKSATPEQVQEVHAFIRSEIAAFDAKIASSLPILYGGSVKASNASELFLQPDVDGGLVGGASLIAQEFIAIVAAAAS